VHTGWQSYWVEEYYPDTIYWDLAEPVEVELKTDTPGIDFALVLGGSISGTVTEYGQDPVVPIEGLDVVVCHVEAEPYDCSAGGATTWTDGGYTVSGLPAGDYYVFVYQQGNWIEQFYDNAPNWDGATSVTVTAGADRFGTDFELVMAE